MAGNKKVRPEADAEAAARWHVEGEALFDGASGEAVDVYDVYAEDGSHICEVCTGRAEADAMLLASAPRMRALLSEALSSGALGAKRHAKLKAEAEALLEALA